MLAEELARVKRASSAAEVAQGLRRMLRERPSAASDAIDAFLGECDARSYAPTAGEPDLEAEFLEQAAGFAHTIAGAGR